MAGRGIEELGTRKRINYEGNKGVGGASGGDKSHHEGHEGHEGGFFTLRVKTEQLNNRN